MITEERADELSNTPKVLTEDWMWNYKSERDMYENRASVRCQLENTTLTLVGWVNKRRYSFSLLHKGQIPIRRWGFHPGHVNPDNERIDGPHKHKWREDHKTEFAYETDDVSTSSVDQAFKDFLDEESIEHKGEYYELEGSRIDDWV